MKPAIGIIGIGNMGMGIALRLLDKGYTVGVRDIDAARVAAAVAAGAQAYASPQALAEQCDVLIVVVVNAAQTQAVLFSEQCIATATHKPRCVMLCPTISPDDVKRFAAQLKQQGIDTIDAPMSGGPKRAREGSMSLMVACEDALYASHQPLLSDMASRLFHVSERVGDGARTKLVNNLLASINLAGAAQCLALAERMGLDMRKTLAVVEQSSGQSWIGSERMQRALSQSAPVLSHMSLLTKDSALAMQAASELNMQPSLGKQAAEIFRAACEAGFEAADDAELLKYFQAQYREQ